jgi:hypothetical protein
MPVLALLPLWMFFYWRAMQPPQNNSVGPTAAGQVVFAKCSSCHSTDGSGVTGAGRQLSNGEVLKTFPKIQDQLTFVYTGSGPWAGKGYGDPNRPGGQHVAGQQFPVGAMPSWGSDYGGELSDLEILEVVCHERFDLSGEDTTNAEYLSWCTLTGDNYQKVATGGFSSAGIATKPPS